MLQTGMKQGRAKRVKQGPDLVEIETLESQAFYLGQTSTLPSTIGSLLKWPWFEKIKLANIQTAREKRNIGCWVLGQIRTTSKLLQPQAERWPRVSVMARLANICQYSIIYFCLYLSIFCFIFIFVFGMRAGDLGQMSRPAWLHCFHFCDPSFVNTLKRVLTRSTAVCIAFSVFFLWTL